METTVAPCPLCAAEIEINTNPPQTLTSQCVPVNKVLQSDALRVIGLHHVKYFILYSTNCKKDRIPNHMLKQFVIYKVHIADFWAGYRIDNGQH